MEVIGPGGAARDIPSNIPRNGKSKKYISFLFQCEGMIK
jgi:hypothetical protein